MGCIRDTTYLGLYIQDTTFSLLLNQSHGLKTSSVIIAGKLSIFNECALLDKIQEFLTGNKMITLAVDLVRAGIARRIFKANNIKYEMERAQSIRDTLNPNLSGNSENKRWSRVLLPTPDGPEMTSGRRKSGQSDIDTNCHTNT